MIDLRSDTVTQPTAAMREAMATAPVGDDVYGEDPSINDLQALAAELTGKEAALFVTSGTQGNLTAVMSHCQRGEEYIAGSAAHTYRYEAGGAAVLGSIQPRPIDFDCDGTLDLEAVRAAIAPDDPHFAQTTLLCIENTQDGRVLPVSYHRACRDLVDDVGLSLHLDGARIFNAAVAQGVSLRELTEPVDTVSFCLSKGLGAPAGSVLCGSTELIARAHRNRKILGGALRQGGVLAAAGLHALDNHVDRLADDHVNAARLAAGLGGIDGIAAETPDTNMVWIEIEGDPSLFDKTMTDAGVNVRARSQYIRLVTHLDVSADDVEIVVAAAKEWSRVAG